MIEDIIFDINDYFIIETIPIIGGSLTDISYDGNDYVVEKPETITIVTF
jgi:hypothetical protein